MNWEIILEAIGVLVGAVFGATQVLARLPKSRATLKHDLEVLKLLDPNHAQRSLIEGHVQSRIAQVYRPDSDSKSIRKIIVVHQWNDFIFGLVCLFVGALWSVYLFQTGFSWWMILSGFIAFAGFGGILNGLEDKTVDHASDQTGSEQPGAE